MVSKIKNMESFVAGFGSCFIIFSMVYGLMVTTKFVSKEAIEKTGLITIDGIVYRIQKD
jgi:hypothetical protein